jgi:hypothetical protein
MGHTNRCFFEYTQWDPESIRQNVIYPASVQARDLLEIPVQEKPQARSDQYAFQQCLTLKKLSGLAKFRIL